MAKGVCSGCRVERKWLHEHRVKRSDVIDVVEVVLICANCHEDQHDEMLCWVTIEPNP